MAEIIDKIINGSVEISEDLKLDGNLTDGTNSLSVQDIANKVDKTTTINGHSLSSNVTVTKSDIELGNVDNTSDLDKPISTAVQTALDLKADKVGILPHYTVEKTDNVKSFITTHNVSNKPIIIQCSQLLAGSPILCNFLLSGDHARFEAEVIGRDERFTAGNLSAINVSNKTFADILSDTYKQNYELELNKVTSISSSSTDTQYPSAKAVVDYVSSKEKLIEITCSELKTKKENSQLISGKFYRITDYTCTTTTVNTSSAGHVFDIIVKAISENKLSEEAWAAHHEGDTYFANNDLTIWKIWYCLDDDRRRFAWSEENGIVIDNELYLRSKSKDDASAAYGYAWAGVVVNSTIYTNTDNPTIETIAYSNKTGSGTSYTISSIHQSAGKGIIYRMIDEFGNDCPYDFKNILFTKTGDWGSYTNYYTFSCFQNQQVMDASKKSSCRDNIIKGYSSFPMSLPFNVLYAADTILACINNIFESGAENNTFKGPGRNNIVGWGCSRIILGSGNNNVFGPGSGSIKCGNYCSNNTFLSDCHYIYLGQSCDNNFFGAGCYYINFKKDESSSLWYCHNIIVDPDCSYLEIEASESTSNSKKLKNIHIHSGVLGEYKSVKQMTLNVNLPYETDVYQDSSGNLIYAVNNNVEVPGVQRYI